MAFEFLFELPISIGIVFLFGYLSKSRGSIYYLLATVVALALITLTFNEILFLKVWMPGPGITIYFALAITYLEMIKNPVYETLGEVDFPNRYEIKASLNLGRSIEEKQNIYLKYMKQNSTLWGKREKVLNKMNSKALLISFIATFMITFGVVAFLEWQSSAITKFFTDAQVLLKKVFENYSEKENIANIPFLSLKADELKIFLRDIMQYGASIGFILNTLVVLFVNYTFRASIRIFQKKNVIIGSMTNFVFPETGIFTVIIGGTLTIMSSYWKHDFILSFIGINLLIIGLFLYALSGYSIFRLYIRVRFLPLTRLSLIVFLVSILVSNFILFFALLTFYLVIGLINFRFDLRKKALQPKGISVSH